jgi:glycolate oxidase
MKMAQENPIQREILGKLVKILGETKVEKVPNEPNNVVVKPKTTDDVSRIVKLASKKGIPLVPKREGQLAIRKDTSQPQIIINTKDMSGIFDIDDDNPGVLWKDLLGILIKRKYSIGVYPGSFTKTVGEWIDIGGSGIGSYSNGFAVDQVRTMEVVLPDGKVINTGFKKVLANSSGYNLNGLFVGADGTLGVITKVTLKMLPLPDEIRPLYYTFQNQSDMTLTINKLTKLKTTPLNISFLGKNHLSFLRSFGKKIPEIDGHVMNITLAGLKSVVDYDMDIIDSLAKEHGAKKEDLKSSQILWGERFFNGSSKRPGLKPISFEALIPASNLQPMMNDTCTLINKMKLKGAIVGTLCDRSTVSLSPYILSDKKPSDKSKLSTMFAQKFGELALGNNGRPIGTTMYLTSVLKRVYGEGINTILDIKTAIDPHEIMNPQVLK